MNKKQFNRVVNLYRDGVSARVCVANILGMCPSNTDASINIDKFYNDVIINPLIKEVDDLKQVIHLNLGVTEKKIDEAIGKDEEGNDELPY